MKNFIKLSFIAIIGLTISSCAALRDLDMSKLSLGMDKQTVIATLRAKPNKIVGLKSYKNGTVEVLQYYTVAGSADPAAISWLYFYNDKLIQFGMPGRDHDWQYTADNIAAIKE